MFSEQTHRSLYTLKNATLFQSMVGPIMDKLWGLKMSF